MPAQVVPGPGPEAIGDDPVRAGQGQGTHCEKTTSGQHDDTAQLDERRENTPISLFDHQLGSVHGPATRDPTIEAN